MSKRFTYYGSFASWAYLIDLFPSITMAFDFRKLRSSYSGNAIKVLRTSDNTEQDFPFVANEVVGSDVLDFVGWNLFPYSEDLTQSNWTKTNLTVTTNTVVAPDSTTTGDILFETTTNGQHLMSGARPLTIGQDGTVSFWIKDEGRSFVRIITSSNFSQDGTSAVAWLDLSSGTIVSESSGFTGANLTITADGIWYKVSYTMPAISTATSTVIQLNLSPNGSTLSYTGDVTKGVAVWGLQFTESSSPLDYDKTLAGARGFGSLSKGYDQVSGSEDVINSTIIRQPIIVNGGKLISDGGKLALQGGATLGLRSTGTVVLSAYSELFFTFGLNITNTSSIQNIFESSANFNSNNGAILVFIQSEYITVSQRISSGVFSAKRYSISTGRQLITVRFRTGQTASDASQLWINGVEITGTVILTNNSITLSNQVLYLFARNANTNGFLGKYQNYTMYTDPAQKAGIENNINSYHGYY